MSEGSAPPNHFASTSPSSTSSSSSPASCGRRPPTPTNRPRRSAPREKEQGWQAQER
ncbi:hypothetical protein FIBSPDRAFT_859772 [Athelia psychrophila]|uniref:Uncharacterized protein n=1 Tax=Athelia psychrophila TaxID=1759441 RepID=A0A166KRT8_9AGAM|nr:hypothetical protein FIBSPDRAFT_859772 [Fibularhizoctonia sp. CBS 109695]